MSEQRLAGAGLTGQHVEPRTETQLGPIHQEQVLSTRSSWITRRFLRPTPGQNVCSVPPEGLPRYHPKGFPDEPLHRNREAAELLTQTLIERRARHLGERPLIGEETGVFKLSPGSSVQTGRPSTETSTGSSRERLSTATRSPGATTSVRAVSECGAMKETM